MIDEREIVRRAVERLTPPEPSFERMLRRRDRRRRNQRIAAGVVGIAAFVGAVLLVATPSSDRTETPPVTEPTVPPDPDRGIVYRLPPEGVDPSSPKRGELVITFYGRPASTSVFHTPVLQVLVYVDGRVIWREEGGPAGYASRNGFLEQRLTPEGVEVLRSEVLSSGLFDRDREFEVDWPAHRPSLEGLKWGGIQLGSGDRSVRVGWSEWERGFWQGVDATPPTAEQATALRQLNHLFSDLASALPASAWEDPASRPYIPSRYAICYDGLGSRRNPPRELEPPEVVNLLPRRAADLLVGRDRTYEPSGERPQTCSELTTGEARLFIDILEQEGIERHPTTVTTGALEYAVPAPAPIRRVHIRFEPILPHGQWSLFPG